MFDTHTHLYMPEFAFEGQPDGSYEGQCSAVDRALEAGVEMMMFPNVDLDTIGAMRALHAMRPESTVMAMGLHPTEVPEDWHEAMKSIFDELQTHQADYKAIGEVGIDMYWDQSRELQQMEVFNIQVQKAMELDLPVIIHCREGLGQVLEVLKVYPGVQAVFHSFGGTIEDVERIRSVGDFYFGINGIVTFRNCSVREVLPAIGADRILTETDSPYLAPVPHRGKRNESAYMPMIINEIARSLGKAPEETAALTDTNARRFFRL